MRLWSYQMLDVLPRQQLLSQLRECVALSKQIYETGRTNHILINKINRHHIMEFRIYCQLVVDEFERRNYNVSPHTIIKLDICDFRIKYPGYKKYPIYRDWHSERYLRQCLYNLEEKFDCGGVTEQEWKLLTDKFGHLLHDNPNSNIDEDKQ